MHYVIQELRRWEIQAGSMAQAKQYWLQAIDGLTIGQLEQRSIVEEETGEEEIFNEEYIAIHTPRGKARPYEQNQIE